MDGLNLKWSGKTIEENFTMDKFGSLIPNVQHLQMEKVAKMVARQSATKTGYFRRASEITYRTDVEFTNNPYGNTPTVGAGYKLFGPRPFDKIKANGRFDLKPSDEISRRLNNRENAILENQKTIELLHEQLKPADPTSGEYLQWLVEGDQVMTGGGFDGNSVGEVTKSCLNFIIKGSRDSKFADSTLSDLWIRGCKWLRDYLESSGLQPGSLKPEGATFVRLAQESDGMIGYPVYAKALSRLTKEIAVRLLLESGVDTREFVDTTVVDARDGKRVPYRVVDALAYILDHSILNAAEVPSIVTPLARIQKHGWKKEDGQTVAKPSKTRSIYPNSAIAGIIEAMTIAPFNDKLKEMQVSFMPSLQPKEIRNKLTFDMVSSWAKYEGDGLCADWSKYDATVDGAKLATMVFYCVRPFYKAEWQAWIDYVIYCLTFKYLILDSRLCALNNDLFSEAQGVAKHAEVGDWIVFGLTGGLISGAKFTHVGGSMYGEVGIHFVIPKLIGYEPKIGAQGGDDTLMYYPKSLINYASVTDTYKPIVLAAEKLGLEMNASKQMFHEVGGELAKVFLQDVYHVSTKVAGVGSIFRPYDAVFFSERNKGLSIAEQLMAEIARMNQGADSPFVHPVVAEWLKREEMIGILFKEYGESAFEVIIESIGLPVDEIAQRIDVGSFSWGIDRSQLERGNLPILRIIAAESAKLDFKLSPSEVMRSIGVKTEHGTDQLSDPQESGEMQTD